LWLFAPFIRPISKYFSLFYIFQMLKSPISCWVSQVEYQRLFQIGVFLDKLFCIHKLRIKIMHIFIQQQKQVHIFRKGNHKYIAPSQFIHLTSISDPLEGRRYRSTFCLCTDREFSLASIFSRFSWRLLHCRIWEFSSKE